MQIGVDIIEIDRVDQAVGRWGDRFLQRVYTEIELDICRGRVESLAARFAGKEAVKKVLNPSGYIGWHDVEVLSESTGKPLVILSGKARDMALDLGLKKIEISLSHSGKNAVAFAIGTGGE
jgi:holo-[acyl-carrier protein] synthase